MALVDARHPLAEVVQEHAALFRIAGIAGCDIQCMPYQVCRHCRAPYRHNQKENRKCLVCGQNALEEFSFGISDSRRLTRVMIERDYYRNTHLVLGRYRGYGVNPSADSDRGRPRPQHPFPMQVVQHLANVLRDAKTTARPKRRLSNFLAFTLGWFSHVVSDALFKGLYPETAQVNFFGHQYNMSMLPAAETIAMTDISYDFGVHWPTWHRELLNDEPDGGALRHLAMGNPPQAYDPAYWGAEFGQPDPSIGAVLDAVRRLNRKWFFEMYCTPDYTAPTPRLDVRKVEDRVQWQFENMNLGQLRRYAFGTGWYETFIRGVDVYLRVVNEATRLAGLENYISKSREGGVVAIRKDLPDWNLWRTIVSDALKRKKLPDEWGSNLQIDPHAKQWLEDVRNQPVNIILPAPATDYQKQLAETLQRLWRIKPRKAATTTIIIGPPAFNNRATDLCREDILRFKYDNGLAGLIKYRPESDALHLVGLSDFGDYKVRQWLS